MENRPPAYFRARLDAISQAIAQTKEDDQLKFLRNGYMPDLVITSHKGYDNSPLSFLEITSFDTWFAMHPEKVCGQTVKTTSRAFPLAVVGSRDEVVKTIMQGANDQPSHISEAEQELMNLIF